MMGPAPAPCLSSQPSLFMPTIVAGVPAFTLPPQCKGRDLNMGWLPATPSHRSVSHASPAPVSHQNADLMRRQALLAIAAMATALIDPASLPPTPTMVPE